MRWWLECDQLLKESMKNGVAERFGCRMKERMQNKRRRRRRRKGKTGWMELSRFAMHEESLNQNKFVKCIRKKDGKKMDQKCGYGVCKVLK